MPWCEQCAKFWTPSSMTPEGACPSCGRVLPRAETPAAGGAGPAGSAVGDGADGSEPGDGSPRTKLSGADLREMAGDEGRAPWHFKLMVVALVLYLGWRLVDLVMAILR